MSPLRIEIPGGWLAPSLTTWTDAATQVKSPYWHAYSNHTHKLETFFTRKMAEFVIWVNNERVESERFRGVRS